MTRSGLSALGFVIEAVSRLESLKHSWRKACERVGLGKLVAVEGTKKKVWVGKIPHDFRRTAVRNMVRAGVPEKIAMAISVAATRPARYLTVTTSSMRQILKRPQSR